MQNSMVIYIFSVFNQKYLFGQIWCKKIKLVSLSWNFLPRITWTCRIQCLCSLFLFKTSKNLFWANLVQKNKIVSLSRNFVPRLIWICRIQNILNILNILRRIWSKNSKLFVQSDTKIDLNMQEQMVVSILSALGWK